MNSTQTDQLLASRQPEDAKGPAPVAAEPPAAPIPVVTEKSKTTITTDTNPPKASTVKPVHIDGALYMGIGLLTAAYESLTSDDASHFASPGVLFWSKLAVGSVNAGFLALKMYRSTGYADSRA